MARLCVRGVIRTVGLFVGASILFWLITGINSPGMVNNVKDADVQTVNLQNTLLNFQAKENNQSDIVNINIRPDPSSKILLLAYYRGGSTFLGELFRQNKAAFYWFEPLRPPVSAWQRKGPIREDLYTPGKDGELEPLPDEKITYLTDILEKILNCEIHLLEDSILDHPFVTEHWTTEKMQPFVKCLRHEKWYGHVDGKSPVQRCAHHMTEECRKSEMTSLKVVRMNLRMASDLISRDPQVKVIYYVRDPRGMLLSRSALKQRGRTAEEYYSGASRSLCRRMRDDLVVLEDLKVTHPGSVYVDKYESLAVNTTVTAERMYRFLGRDVPESVLSWLRRSQEESRSKGEEGRGTKEEDRERHDAYATFGKNSTAVASRWKTELSPEVIDIITTNCEDVLKMIDRL